MSDNIIDFNRHKQQREEAPQDFDFSLDALMERLETLPENALMNSVAEYTNGRMLKQLIMTDVARQVSEMLQSIGFDPDDFELDEESADRFLSDPDIVDPDNPFNGPFFDHYDENSMTRVVTAFQPEGDEDEDAVNLLMAVLKLDDGADRWMRWADGQWIDGGLPAGFFDDLADGIWDDEDWDDEDWDDDDDWDDDEDDELFQQEPWEDEYDESIYSLYLMPQAYRALSKAGIETIEQLAKLTDLELLAIDGIDAKALEIIREALDDEDMEAGE